MVDGIRLKPPNKSVGFDYDVGVYITFIWNLLVHTEMIQKKISS